jgi:hypothetical protein
VLRAEKTIPALLQTLKTRKSGEVQEAVLRLLTNLVQDGKIDFLYFLFFSSFLGLSFESLLLK